MKSVDEALKRVESPRGYRMLVVEDSGRTHSSDVTRSNPFPRANCGKSKCLMCTVGDSNGSCYKSKVVYKVECSREPCTKKSDSTQSGSTQREHVPVSVYIGETSRTLYKRALEHKALYEKKSSKNFMWRHTEEHHNGVITNPETDYRFGVVSSHQEALNRVLDEAVRIQDIEGDSSVNSMNGRQEYYAPQYVRPAFEKGPAERQFQQR